MKYMEKIIYERTETFDGIKYKAFATKNKEGEYTVYDSEMDKNKSSGLKAANVEEALDYVDQFIEMEVPKLALKNVV